jgi:hypothetical protein
MCLSEVGNLIVDASNSGSCPERCTVPVKLVIYGSKHDTNFRNGGGGGTPPRHLVRKRTMPNERQTLVGEI